jgi:general secretion pathway protein J
VRRSARRSRGFTLIEVMLTVAITVAVFAALGEALLSVITTSERIERKLRTEKAGYGILATLRRDLTGVYAYALGGAALKGEDKTAGGGDADELHFATTANVIATTDGRPPLLVEVGYRLEDQAQDRGLSLFRSASALEGDPLSGGGDYVEIATGLKSLKLQYLDPEDQAWKDAWEQAERIPLAVKVKLELIQTAEERAEAEQAQVDLPPPTFEMIVGIPARQAPPPDAPPTPPPAH